jgi:hypothetical protein
VKQHGTKPGRVFRVRTQTRATKEPGVSREVETITTSAFPGDPWVVFDGAAATNREDILDGLMPKQFTHKNEKVPAYWDRELREVVAGVRVDNDGITKWTFTMPSEIKVTARNSVWSTQR